MLAQASGRSDGWLGDSSRTTLCVRGLILSERVRRLNRRSPSHSGEGAVGR